MNLSLFPILIAGMLVVAVGALVIWGIAQRYRRELGLRSEEQEKTQDVTFIINAFHDVTRQLKEKERELVRLRTLAEQRAENVESYTENILQCVTSGVITFDGNGLAASMNRAAEEILGLGPGSGLGRTCEEIFGNSATCRLVRDTLEKSVLSRRMESEMLRKGERIWLGFNTALLKDRQ